jgi:hypothetical protein
VADHDHRERYLALAEAIVGAFENIRSFLAQLPVPVTVPDLDPEATDTTKALYGLDRVRQLIKAEPISEGHKRAIESMILDWFAAYEVGALYRLVGPAPWRLDAIEHALERLMVSGDTIENDQLGDDKS